MIDRISGNLCKSAGSGLVGLGSFKSQHDSSIVTVRKVGYQDTTFLVMQSDTIPITLMLEHAAPVLPTVLTEAAANGNNSTARSEIESIAISTDAKFIPPGVLRSPASHDV